MLRSNVVKVASLRFFVEFKVAAFRRIKGSIWQMHRTYVSIWVATSNRTWKKSKAICVL